MSEAADQARKLADLFAEMARSVDDFRVSELAHFSAEEQQRLSGLVQQLDDIHDRFTAAAIQATLDSIANQLPQVVNVTKQANDSVKHLQTVGQIAALVSAASELAEDLFIADYGAIPASLEDLQKAVAGNNS